MTVSPTARFPATRLREPRDAAEVYGVCLCVLFDGQLQLRCTLDLSLTRAVPWRPRGLVSPGIPAICGPGDTSYRWFRLHRWLSSGQPVYATNPIGGYCACYSLDVVAAVRAAIATGSRQRFPVPRSSGSVLASKHFASCAPFRKPLNGELLRRTGFRPGLPHHPGTSIYSPRGGGRHGCWRQRLPAGPGRRAASGPEPERGGGAEC